MRIETTIVAGLTACLLLEASAQAAESRDQCVRSQEPAVLTRCADSRVYDPCDSADGKWQHAQCATLRQSTADQSLKDVEHEIQLRLKRDGSAKLQNDFQESQRLWLAYRAHHCAFTDSVADSAEFNGSSYFHLRYCDARLTQARALDLRALLSP